MPYPNEEMAKNIRIELGKAKREGEKGFSRFAFLYPNQSDAMKASLEEFFLHFL